jgi:histone acetyltransferase (RNA polymerase elongator complex component)
MIIPFFIPHSGCQHQCVFCNQNNILGRSLPENPSAIADKIRLYRGDHALDKSVHVAFYGGSFTALPMELQKNYLAAVQPFIHTGLVRDIRLSTRPDCINENKLFFLKSFQVHTVELGAQSMNDNVLTLSGRGHTAAATDKSLKLLRQYEFSVGIQLMPGLPGDSVAIFRETVDKVIKLKPDFIRLYPVLVIRDTPLATLFRSGRYTPLALESSVEMCREAYLRFEQKGIDVIRMGLQPTEELDKPGTVLAGPYHPAFRQLVESSILLDKMRSALASVNGGPKSIVLLVNPRDVSAAIGQKRENIEIIKKEFGLGDIAVHGDHMVSRHAVVLVTNKALSRSRDGIR